MTQIIHANFTSLFHTYPSSSTQLTDINEMNILRGNQTNSEKFMKQKVFSAIINEIYCPYNLLVTIIPYIQFTTIKVYLIKKCGDLLKIREQQSKTYLIRKFIGFQNVYRPQIDPLTGYVYFRIDYFELKKDEQRFDLNEAKRIFKSVNLERLYQSIQKLGQFYQQRQQHNWSDNNYSFRKQYKSLSKAISILDGAQSNVLLSDYYSNSQQTKTQNEKRQNKKNLINQINQFLLSSKISQPQIKKNILAKQIKQIQLQANNISSLTKRKNGKSNYESLLINHQTQKLLKQAILKTVQTKTIRTNMKVSESQLGKITLNLQRDQEPVFRAKIKFLLAVNSKNIQYHFLDKYFKNDLNNPVLISLSLKQETLPRFLQSNAISLSLETKMRVFVQICSAVHTLWEQKNVILYVNNLKKMYITKNLTIKIRNLTNYYKAESHNLLEDKAGVNVKLIDNWLNLADIYFRLFHKFSLGFVRPSANGLSGAPPQEVNKVLVMGKRTTGQKLLPQGFKDPIKQILTGLNYIFLSFIGKAEKIIIEPYLKRKRGKLQMFIEQNKDSDSDYKLTSCWLFKNFELITKQSI